MKASNLDMGSFAKEARKNLKEERVKDSFAVTVVEELYPVKPQWIEKQLGLKVVSLSAPFLPKDYEKTDKDGGGVKNQKGIRGKVVEKKESNAKLVSKKGNVVVLKVGSDGEDISRNLDFDKRIWLE
ncbi:hypothetical protein QYF36_022541 [Acer negundo]|nr:hypothetical protein QYF36_022541 [Acer negundo]